MTKRQWATTGFMLVFVVAALIVNEVTVYAVPFVLLLLACLAWWVDKHF